MKTYIITGASGFIGKNLVKKLALNHDNTIHVILRGEKSASSELLEYENVKVHYIPLSHIEKIEEIEKSAVR